MTNVEWRLDVAQRLGELAARAEDSARAVQEVRIDVRSGFDRLTSVLEAHARRDEELTSAVDHRVRNLERFRTWLVGVAAGLGAVFATVFAVIRALASWR